MIDNTGFFDSFNPDGLETVLDGVFKDDPVLSSFVNKELSGMTNRQLFLCAAFGLIQYCRLFFACKDALQKLLLSTSIKSEVSK